jgi:NADPH2:quinone reductase
MRAMKAEGFNGYQDLKLVDIPKPELSDHTILSGNFPLAKAPLVLGNEGVGAVEDANGSDFRWVRA